jgi:hypothetical protein
MRLSAQTPHPAGLRPAIFSPREKVAQPRGKLPLTPDPEGPSCPINRRRAGDSSHSAAWACSGTQAGSRFAFGADGLALPDPESQRDSPSR